MECCEEVYGDRMKLRPICKKAYHRQPARSRWISSSKYYLILFAAILSRATAQQSLVPPTHLLFTDVTAVHLGIESKSISIGGRQYSQTAIPTAVVVPLLQNLILRATNSPSLTASDTINSLSGFSDTQIGLSYFLFDEHLLFMLDANLPSGRKIPSKEKQAYSTVVGFQPLGYQVQSFGQGFDLQVSGAYAFRIAEKAIMNIGGAYLRRGDYQPIDTLGQYDPGDEITISVGGDYQFTRRIDATLDASLTSYGEDQLTSVDTRGYSIGDPYVIRAARMRLMLSSRVGIATAGGAEHIFLLRLRFRLGSDEVKLENATLAHGPQMEFRYDASLPLDNHGRWLLRPSAHRAYFAESELNPAVGMRTLFQNAFLATPGIGIAFVPHPLLKLESAFRYTIGRANVFGENESISGLTAHLKSSFFF